MSTIDVATRTKNPTDIAVGVNPDGVAITPAGATAFITNRDGPDPIPDPTHSGKVSTIDVATRTKNPTDITGFEHPSGIAITPDGATADVTNFGNNYVSTIDVATRTKNPANIDVGEHPGDVAITPNGTTAYVTNLDSGSVSTVGVGPGPRTRPTSRWAPVRPASPSRSPRVHPPRGGAGHRTEIHRLTVDRPARGGTGPRRAPRRRPNSWSRLAVTAQLADGSAGAPKSCRRRR